MRSEHANKIHNAAQNTCRVPCLTSTQGPKTLEVLVLSSEQCKGHTQGQQGTMFANLGHKEFLKQGTRQYTTHAIYKQF